LWGLTFTAIIVWSLAFQVWTNILQFSQAYILGFGLFMLVSLVLCIAAVVALVKTSKRESAGSVAIVFTSGGFMAIADLETAQFEGEIVKWNRVAGVQLKRVSRFWYKIKIWSRNETLLDGGVRCTDELAPLVHDTLQAFRHGEEPNAQSSSTTSPQIGPSGVS